MNRNYLWKILLVLFVVGFAANEMYRPTGRPLLEVFQENAGKRDGVYSNIMAQAEVLQRQNPQAEFKNLRTAIGTNDISRHFDIDTKGAKEPTAAILNYLQKKAAGKIKLGLDLQGGSSFLVEMQTGKLATNTSQKIALDNAIEVLRKRVDKFGVAEPLIQAVGDNRILIQMPGLGEAEMESVRNAIQRAAFLEFRMVNEESPKLLQEGIIPPGYEVMKESRSNPDGTKTVQPFLVSKARVEGLNGKNIKSAGFTRGSMNDPQIAFRFDTEGTAAFAKLTTENVGKQMAIILDGELYSAPVIRTPITEGSGSISGGSMTEKDAIDIAAILQNPLEAPVEIISETKVEPSLGKDTVTSGVNSAKYGVIAVAIFMAIYYLMAGMVANFALVLNIIILLGVLCAFGTTLTLPGIAGIVLTIGMAVDANVLIFERIREESAKGKSLRGALAAGYDRAFGTIFDSNITTLIASVLLIKMGTGSIKGFGVTLTIGILASMFTALFVTRLVFDLLLARNWLKSLPMLHIIRAGKIDFMRWAKPAFALSWLLIIIGVGFGFYRGFSKHDILGIDFVGGDSLTINFKQKEDVDKIRSAIRPVAGDALIQYQKDIIGTTERLSITAPFNSGDKVMSALTAAFPNDGFKLAGSERKGPSVGEEILKSAILAVLLALLGILVYVAFRYEFSFAVGAVIAIIHDVLMTLGWYALSGRELNATMVAAVLTIIGFSINDTIVIFDRIREDLKLGVRGTFRELINQALNETLSRTIITSGTVFIATMALYLLGGGAINDFAFTFLVGIITGTYSSIYIASALVLWWHKGQRPTTSTQVSMEGATVLKTANAKA